jgi:glucose-1-phosphate thymidylyltransferase
MIYHPIRACVNAGIEDILIVTGGNCSDGFLTLLQDGKHLGVKQLYYAHQVGAGGIAEALKLAESFVGDDNFTVILGDNIFTANLKPHVEKYLQNPKSRFVSFVERAQIHLYEVDDPERFGCPEFLEGRISKIYEKPETPPSNYAVVGVYFYPPTIFTEVLPHLKPSKRGEIEITDVNNHYLSINKLDHSILGGEWSDAGTWKSWWEANNIIRNHDKNK